jgi:hypothetical protein
LCPVETTLSELAQTLRVQHQEGKETLGNRIARIVSTSACDGPDAVGIVRNHLSDTIRSCDTTDSSRPGCHDGINDPAAWHEHDKSFPQFGNLQILQSVSRAGSMI